MLLLAGLAFTLPLTQVSAQTDPFAPAPYKYFGRSFDFDHTDGDYEHTILYHALPPGGGIRDVPLANHIKMQVAGAPLYIRYIKVNTEANDPGYTIELNRAYQIGETIETSLPYFPADRLGSISIYGSRLDKFFNRSPGFVKAWYTPLVETTQVDLGKGQTPNFTTPKVSTIVVNGSRKLRMLTVKSWQGIQKIQWLQFRTTDGVWHPMPNFDNAVLDLGSNQEILFPNGATIDRIKFSTVSVQRLYPWNDPLPYGQLWITAAQEN